ncbi:retrotransposon protein, putative, ty3-gypsy subclass [Tanacetum coccineum]
MDYHTHDLETRNCVFTPKVRRYYLNGKSGDTLPIIRAQIFLYYYLNKSVHSLPNCQDYSDSKIARIFQQEIVQLHGTPSAIVSDKDPRFTFRILETHTRQEGYTNKLSRPLSLQPNYLIFLKVSPTSGSRRFGITDKFCFIRPFEILDRIHEDLSHLNEPEAILNCQDRVRIFRPFSKDILSIHDSFPQELLCFPISMLILLPDIELIRGHSSRCTSHASPLGFMIRFRRFGMDGIGQFNDSGEIPPTGDFNVFKTRLDFVIKFDYERVSWWKAYEQTKKFRWSFHKSILDHLMCILFIDIAQFADVAHNLEILHDTEDYDGSEQSGKKRVSSCCQKLLQVRPDWPPPARMTKMDTATSTSGHAGQGNTDAFGPLSLLLSRIKTTDISSTSMTHSLILEMLVVEGFSRLALPLTKLTRKDEKLYGSKSERRSLKNHGEEISYVSVSKALRIGPSYSMIWKLRN